MKVILASASPRRFDYLKGLGLDPTVMPSNVDENSAETDPVKLAIEIAIRKAEATRDECAAKGVVGDVIVAADTNVVIDDQILGKPRDPSDAISMLNRLSGRSHRVVTGVCVIRMSDGKLISAAEQTRVDFTDIPAEAIEAYVSTGEPMDKAGAYGIQGKAAVFICSIEGCFFNVAGIPLSMLRRMLEELGFSVWKVW